MQYLFYKFLTFKRRIHMVIKIAFMVLFVCCFLIINKLNFVLGWFRIKWSMKNNEEKDLKENLLDYKTQEFYKLVVVVV